MPLSLRFLVAFPGRDVDELRLSHMPSCRVSVD